MKPLFFTLFLSISLLAQAQIWNSPESVSPIEVGVTISDGALIDKNLNETSLYKILNNETAVLVIYRGGWCPYCNKQLAELTEVESQISELGYRIIAISPEDAVNIKKSIDKNDINYELYSDKGAQLIQELGLAFYTNDRTNNYISKKSDGSNSGVLPVPSVIVLDQHQKVNYIYSDPDYKVRLDSKELLEVLKSLQ